MYVTMYQEVTLFFKKISDYEYECFLEFYFKVHGYMCICAKSLQSCSALCDSHRL